MSFTGTISNGNVLLNWVTATEVNNYGWEVQRTLKEDSFYETIGFIEGAGNSNSPHSYVFKDEPIQYGEYIYRIKQIDNDGTFEYNGTVEFYMNITIKVKNIYHLILIHLIRKPILL